MAAVRRPRRVREVRRRAEEIRPGDAMLGRGGRYHRVLEIASERSLQHALDALGRRRVLRRPVLVFRLADGMRWSQFPGTVCDVLEVTTWR
jgi:hypothetical protein